MVDQLVRMGPTGFKHQWCMNQLAFGGAFNHTVKSTFPDTKMPPLVKGVIGWYMTSGGEE